MRGLDQRLQLVDGECRNRLAVRSGAIIGIDLDPVRAVARLMADRAHDLVDPARFFRALRETAIGAEFRARGAIGPRRDNGARNDDEAWTRNNALVNRALDRDIGITRAFGAEIAQQREPRAQRRLGVAHRAHGAIGLALLQHLIVPRRLVVGMQEEMGMQVHQSR